MAAAKSPARFPPALRQQAKEAHEALVELVAEGKDELMEEFFAEGTIPEQHLITALHEAIREDRIFPVLFASGGTNVATDHLLDFIKVYAPSPTERAPIPVKTPAMQAVAANGNGGDAGASGGTSFRKVDDSEPAAVVVFKTMSDPFAGRITFFKVVSGVRQERCHARELHAARPGALLAPERHAGAQGGRSAGAARGRSGRSCQAARHADRRYAGCEGRARSRWNSLPLPEPAMTYAIEPKTRADEDKLAPAIHKLMEEDLLIRFFRDPQTNEFLIAGAGQPHIETIVSRLKKRYHAEVTLKAPKVPYRETHSRQGRRRTAGTRSRAAGTASLATAKSAWSHCRAAAGSSLRTRSSAEPFRVSSYRRWKRALSNQPLAATWRAIPSSTSRRRFSTAATTMSTPTKCRSKWRAGWPSASAWNTAKPCLLEPVMKVEIEAPDEFAGTLMGDLNSRRGRVQGMESKGRTTVINAEVPMAEMLTYGTLLTSMTQGKGSYRMEMHHYDIVPQLVADKILANAKRPIDEEEE